MMEVHGNTNVSCGTARVRQRRGTTKCPHCDEPRVAGHAYCREHRAQYQKEWRKKQRDELQRIRAQAQEGAQNG